jgi:uncharacterized protein YgbK (DUF1537 family)
LLQGVPAVVLDGVSSADIQTAAKRIMAMDPPPLAAGPGALAGALAGRISWPCRREVLRVPRLPRCLVINGSMHPASVEQIAFARMQGCFDSGWRYFDGAAGGAGVNQPVQIGEAVRWLIRNSPVDALVVFGGDTAFAIHRALGGQPFDVWGEVLPGVPVSRSGELFWVTKAGGFGAPETLHDIRRALT